MRPFHHEVAPRNENVVGHIIFMVMAVIFWAVIIYGMILLINRYAKHNDSNQNAADDPLQIAKARYAKGEITKEEFNRLKKDLA